MKAPKNWKSASNSYSTDREPTRNRGPELISIYNPQRIALPFYLWLLAGLAGALVAAASLSYSPQGRINLLWVWLIWAGLPLIGTLGALLFGLFGSRRPWLFQWRGRSVQWYPSRPQRWHMLWLVQWLWLAVGLGMLCGYFILLLFSDLAFGWSSTLLQDTAVITRLTQAIAAPWALLWPAAVPDAGLVSATQFQRIRPEASSVALAGDWWRFLMASLIVYNLLPRALLALLFYIRWRMTDRTQLEVRSPVLQVRDQPAPAPLREEPLTQWQAAVPLNWEHNAAPADESFGLQSWAEDEQRLDRLLQHHPRALLWQVSAPRSPVAELGDLVQKARQAGVQRQALMTLDNRSADPQRHLASWRGFARQHQLVWISDE